MMIYYCNSNTEGEGRRRRQSIVCLLQLLQVKKWLVMSLHLQCGSHMRGHLLPEATCCDILICWLEIIKRTPKSYV